MDAIGQHRRTQAAGSGAQGEYLRMYLKYQYFDETATRTHVWGARSLAQHEGSFREPAVI